VWDVYYAAVGEIAIAQVSLRYINRFDIPLHRDVAEFLRVYPPNPGDLPQEMTKSALRVDLQLPETPGGLLVLQQYLDQPLEEGKANVILDLDHHLVIPESASQNDIRMMIDSLREVKNKTFISCLSPQTQEMIS